MSAIRAFTAAEVWSTLDWDSATVVTTGAYDSAASTVSGSSVTLVTKNATHGAPDAGLDAGGLWLPISVNPTAFGIAFEMSFGSWTGLQTSDIGVVLCLADRNSEVASTGIYAGMTARSSGGGNYRAAAGYVGFTHGTNSGNTITPTECHGSLLFANSKGVVASSTLFDSTDSFDPHAVHNRETNTLGSSLYLGLLPIVIPTAAPPATLVINSVKWAEITAP